MEYYHFVRREIEPLLPSDCRRILEVGAGAGSTLKWLKTIYPAAETTAVELNSTLLTELERNVDVAIIGRVEDVLTELKTYDLILMLDVLEHLPNSTGTLKKISRLLEPRGQVIVSVPNISHLSVSIPLLLHRRFSYQDAGILDRTHLRFFVEDSAVKLLNNSNLIVTAGLISGIQGPKAKFLNYLTFGFLRHHLAKQYIMLGQPSDREVVQGSVRWMVAQ